MAAEPLQVAWLKRGLPVSVHATLLSQMQM